MAQSRRHHYVPQFLIKNFTNSDGFVHVYNKETGRIINTPQSPKAIFYENDRNTVNFSGTPLDNLEKLYGELDTKAAIDIVNLLKTNKPTPEEIASVIFLASQLKWRTPVADSNFNELKNDTSIEDLQIKITIKGENKTIDAEALAHIEQSDIFKETKRVLLGVLPLLKPDILMQIHNNSFIYTNTHFPALIGDSPVIEAPNNDYRKLDDFIFPLSSDATFIYKNGCKGEVPHSAFCFQRNLAIFHYSKKYVACCNKEHLQKLVELYSAVKGANKIDGIEKHLFNFIQ